MSLAVVEPACVAIVVAYVAWRLRPGVAERRAAIALRLACLVVAAWVGEDSVICAYGFYSYAPAWSLFVDRVPLLVVLIWPVVIDSAHALARRLAGVGAGAGDSPLRVAALGGAIVLADASLIEPIAVRAGLWTWSPENARSLFDVPPIGILGWAYFAAAAIATFEARRDRFVIVAAPIAAHVALVASWWGVFRWIDGVPPDPPEWTAPALAWAALLPLALVLWRMRSPIAPSLVLARLPGALFFFALLAATARDRVDLVLYALAFAPPYLACLARARLSPTTSTAESAR